MSEGYPVPYRYVSTAVNEHRILAAEINSVGLQCSMANLDVLDTMSLSIIEYHSPSVFSMYMYTARLVTPPIAKRPTR